MAKVTMKDVAKHAGVSVATVSNVLNNVANKTTEATKKKVLQSVKEMNYRMDMTARSLSMGKSNLIGIFLPEMFENSMPSSVLKTNPFYSEMISGIEYEARILGYDILISNVKSSEHVQELVNKRMLDGIIILGDYDDQFWKDLNKSEVPVVVSDSYNYDRETVSNVGIDDELGAYLAVKHLITLGHRHIALAISDFGTSQVGEKRYTGFRRAISEAAIPYEDCPVVQGDVSFKGGVSVGHQLLKDHRSVTAVFAAADIMALGIIKIMNQFGKNIPQDLSVIGFDDLSLCEYTFPALTTIRQDVYKKGIEVARLLVRKIDGEPHIRSQTLPVELIVRETTKALL